MEGQWTGIYQGSSTGQLILDLDDLGSSVEGHAFLFDNAPLPASVVPLKFNKASVVNLDVEVFPMRPEFGALINRDELSRNHPQVVFPQKAKVRIRKSPRRLYLSWKTDIGTVGRVTLLPSSASNPSSYKPLNKVKNWAEFKKHVTGLPPGKYIFRGQNIAKRLRTAFHRSSRKDLVRFANRDIPAIHRALSGQTSHFYNLNDPLQNGAFWNLIQHHGYPTPLLDWSYSPFVAAFFAYRRANLLLPKNEKVRIYIFDKDEWVKTFSQIQLVEMAPPHFSILEALNIGNSRAVPQQALSSLTNVDDIESYIAAKEIYSGKKFLSYIDLPVAERQSVIEELGMMGVTAGSLFPGLDGACEELREKFF